MKAIFSITIVLCAILISGCGGVNEKSPTAKKIEQVVRREAGMIFTMKTMTDFQWDRLFVFHPYESRRGIHEAIGIDFLKDDEIPDIVEERDCFLVFVKEGRVVEYFTYPRFKGDFEPLSEKTGGFSPEEAILEVVSRDNGRWKLIKSVGEN